MEFIAICVEMNPRDAMHLLNKNVHLELGSFGIGPIDEIAYFVLQHRLRVEEVHPTALSRIVPYLAEQADKLEAELHPNGGNRYRICATIDRTTAARSALTASG